MLAMSAPPPLTAAASPADAPQRRAYPADATIDGWLAPDHWPLRHFRWPAPAGAMRGSLLFVGGRGDIFEKYLESFAHWHGQGWRIDSFDWRGQGGSGRLTADPHVGHIGDYALWIADLEAFVAQWRAATPGPHVIIAHSMGGHLLLRALVERVVAVEAAVLVAPMLGFRAPYPQRLGHWIAGLMSRILGPERAAWRVSEKPGSSAAMRQKLLTHDADRYADELWWHATKPELQLGPASWWWVRQGYASFLQLGRPAMLEAVTTPLLILSASHDALIAPAAIRHAAARLPAASLHEYGAEAAHELLREADGVRDDALARIDAFLAREAPAP